MKVLITGTDSGLGKFLSKQFINCDKFTRKSALKDYQAKHYDLIIHCAAKISHYSWDDEIPHSFFDDNIFLTDKLLNIPCEKFIYISSIDQQKNTPYGISKRISEKIVIHKSHNHLIIRSSGLLGKEMRENSFQKMLKGKPIGLTGDSLMNYILYDDILNVINENVGGIVTLMADENITLNEIAVLLDKDVEFGNYKFSIEQPVGRYKLHKTSKENVLEFLHMINER